MWTVNEFSIIWLCSKTVPKTEVFFIRGNLLSKPYEKEQCIINFNKLCEKGTHWVCYLKKGDLKRYFNSMGDGVLQEVCDYHWHISHSEDFEIHDGE